MPSVRMVSVFEERNDARTCMKLVPEYLSNLDWRSTGIKTGEIAGLALVLFVVAYYSLNWAIGALVHDKAQIPVPDITKRSVVEALSQLSAAKLAVQKEGEQFDASVPVGAVISQLPPAGTMVREGKIIRVWISQGGESVFAPNLIGLPERNAELLLRQQQLLLGEVGAEPSLKSDKGVVISQDPVPDSSLAKNSLVNIVVSAGPPPPGIVLMPDFRQKQIADANQWSAQNKLTFDLKEEPASLFPNGTIIAQDPPPDTTISPDTRVIITISGRKDAGDAAGKVHHIHYEMSQGSSQSRLRIVIIDKSGEREIFNGLRAPGSKIDLTAPYGGPAKVRIFVNGILVDEREMP